MLSAILVAAILIAMLAIPVALSYRISWRESVCGNIEIRWLFGLVRARLPLNHAEIKSSGTHGTAALNGISRPWQSHPAAAFGQKPFRRRIIRFMRQVWRALHKRKLYLRLRIGLGDPADTGRLWAIVGPVAGLLAGSRAFAVDIEPEFMDATFELDSSGDIRMIPLQMIYLTLGLLMSPAIWRGLGRMRDRG